MPTDKSSIAVQRLFGYQVLAAVRVEQDLSAPHRIYHELVATRARCLFGHGIILDKVHVWHGAAQLLLCLVDILVEMPRFMHRRDVPKIGPRRLEEPCLNSSILVPRASYALHALVFD